MSEYVKNHLALDVMEVDYTMREKIAMERARQIMSIKEANESNSNVNDSLDKSLNSSKRRNSTGSKRLGQEERNAELIKLKNTHIRSLTSYLISDQKEPRDKAFIEGFIKNDEFLAN